MQSQQSIPPHIANLIAEFDINGKIIDVEIVGSGVLNKSFKLINADSSLPDYLLERIDHLAFRNIPGMMENIMRVTQHLQQQANNAPAYKLPTLINLRDGGLYNKDYDGNYWRMFIFEKEAQNKHAVNDEAHAYKIGSAFGWFLKSLVDVDASQLHDTVIGLHDTEYRLGYLEDAVNNNIAGRAASIQPELDFVNERADAMCGVLYLGMAGRLPLRAMHNSAGPDSLLQGADKALDVIINLDTVMAGYTAYDFGEGYRAIMFNNPATNGDGPQADVLIFEAYTRGYMEQAGGVLQPLEVQSLMLGVLMMPYLYAVRYLNDYLNGDINFKADYPDHNFARARRQIELIKNIEKVEDRLREIIHNAAATNA